MNENKTLAIVCLCFLAIIIFVSQFYYLSATQFRCADGTVLSIPMVCR